MDDESAVYQQVRFEFVGGPHDGLVVHGVFGPDHDDANGLLTLTDGGRPGTEFSLPADYAVAVTRTRGQKEIEQLLNTGHRFPAHRYEVIFRWWRNHGLIIRSQYRGPKKTIS